MFRNYLKITFRNIKSYKGFSLINISGLAIGMACTILILLWVQYELSFDRFHENADQLYQAVYKFEDQEVYGRYLPGPLAALLKDEYPDIIDTTTYKPWEKKISFGLKSFFGTGSYVDPSFFEMFTFPFAKGDPKTAFAEPFSIVITEDLANKFFGNENPLGKTLTYYVYSQGIDLNVTGIIKNIPQNSHIQFDFLIPFEIGYQWMKTWRNNAVHTYVQLHEGSNWQDVSKKISNVLNRHIPNSKVKANLYLYPLKKIHLFALEGGGLITYVYIFSVMALVILLIACINFMNLSTARSEKRFKEIGIKKVVGSSRTQLIKQFLSEAIFLSLLALFLATVIVKLLLPSVNATLGVELDLNYSLVFILSLFSMALLTGIASGSYPAFFLSSFQPAAILKGQLSSMIILKKKGSQKSTVRQRGSFLRKVLVVAQFSLSIFFIICVMGVHKQLNYIRNRDLGFDKGHVVVLQATGELKKGSQTIKNELLKNPDIQNVTFSAFSLTDWESSVSGLDLDWTGKMSDRDFLIGNNYVDYDYLKTFNMKMAEGRFFSKEFAADASDACVVNEAAVKAMGMKEPIGKKIVWSSGSQYENRRTIVGVIKDYNTQSLHQEVRPFALMPIENMQQNMSNYMCIKLRSDNIPRSLKLIESKIKEFVPDDPLIYHFLDEKINSLYQTEQLTGKLTRYITFLAIFISCLGLFGLASFSVERRTKEIGVRKVLGASVSKIMLLLTKDFSKWVFLANIIAWPTAWFAMNRWLQNFAYRTDIGIWIFIFSASLAFIIALLVVSYQSIRAALANPVDSLRYE
ncbi:MAG: ABC transporter permease [Candidatus Aminicenantes bacterium]|nr:MAG: ABC transporter permease [Candidatus Aminicenantes bacterium]